MMDKFDIEKIISSTNMRYSHIEPEKHVRDNQEINIRPVVWAQDDISLLFFDELLDLLELVVIDDDLIVHLTP